MATPLAILETYRELINQIGVTALNSAYSRDFEVYLFAIELVDFEDRTIDYFTFPVMPDNISKTEIERTNIMKTFAGTTIINSTSFTPKDLSISGSFGRQFKSTVSNVESESPQYSNGEGVFSVSDLLSNIPSVKKPRAIPYFRTGFGLIKELQSIIDKTKGFDNQGRPFKLFVYNPALGENYLCALPKSPLTFRQSESSSNMVWEYTLNLKIVADLDSINVTSTTTFDNSKIDVINKSITTTQRNVRKYIEQPLRDTAL